MGKGIATIFKKKFGGVEDLKKQGTLYIKFLRMKMTCHQAGSTEPYPVALGMFSLTHWRHCTLPSCSLPVTLPFWRYCTVFSCSLPPSLLPLPLPARGFAPYPVAPFLEPKIIRIYHPLVYFQIFTPLGCISYCCTPVA